MLFSRTISKQSRQLWRQQDTKSIGAAGTVLCRSLRHRMNHWKTNLLLLFFRWLQAIKCDNYFGEEVEDMIIAFIPFESCKLN